MNRKQSLLGEINNLGGGFITQMGEQGLNNSMATNSF